MSFPMVALGEIVQPVERAEVPFAGTIYRQIGVKLWGMGAYERESIDGSQTKYNTLSRVETDDIIVNKIWARNGSVAIVPKNLAGCYVSSEFPTFVPIQDKLDSRWFHWLTKTKFFWEKCDEKSQGTSGKNRIRPERFLEIKIPLPPLSEQRLIVAHIEELAAKIEEARGLRKKAGEEIEALAHAILRHILENNANSPEWEFGHIPQFAEVNPLRRGRTDFLPLMPVSFVPMAAVDDISGSIVKATIRPYAEVSKGYTWFKDGDIIFARITPCMQNGKVALAEGLASGVGFGSTEFHVLRPGPKIMGRWLYILMRHKDFREDAAAHFKGTAGQQRVPQSFLEQKVISLPPLPEQRRIVAYLDALQAKVDALRHLQEETSAELDALMPAVLDRAFKGEL